MIVASRHNDKSEKQQTFFGLDPVMAKFDKQTAVTFTAANINHNLQLSALGADIICALANHVNRYAADMTINQWHNKTN